MTIITTMTRTTMTTTTMTTMITQTMTVTTLTAITIANMTVTTTTTMTTTVDGRNQATVNSLFLLFFHLFVLLDVVDVPVFAT